MTTGVDETLDDLDPEAVEEEEGGEGAGSQDSPSPGDDDTGVESEEPSDEAGPKSLKKLRAHFHRELTKQGEKFESALEESRAERNQLLGALQEIREGLARNGTPRQEEERDQAPGLEEILEKHRPNFAKDPLGAMAKVSSEISDTKIQSFVRAEFDRFRAEQQQGSILGTVATRLENRYPELRNQSSPFFSAVASRFQELAGFYGTVQEKTPLHSTLVAQAAAEVAQEKPSLLKRDNPKGRAADSTDLPPTGGSPPADKKKASDLPRAHETLAKRYKVKDSPELRDAVQRFRKTGKI